MARLPKIMKSIEHRFIHLMFVVLYMIVIHFIYHDYDLRLKFENPIRLNNGIFPWHYHQVPIAAPFPSWIDHTKSQNKLNYVLTYHIHRCRSNL